MRCSNCGNVFNDTFKFCPYCGNKPQQKICPKCSFKSYEFSYCPHCGEMLLTKEQIKKQEEEKRKELINYLETQTKDTNIQNLIINSINNNKITTQSEIDSLIIEEKRRIEENKRKELINYLQTQTPKINTQKTIINQINNNIIKTKEDINNIIIKEIRDKYETTSKTHICPNCGKQINVRAMFCVYCGQQISNRKIQIQELLFYFESKNIYNTPLIKYKILKQKITTTQEIDNITELIEYTTNTNSHNEKEIITAIINQKITTTQEIDNITELIEYTTNTNSHNEKEIITAIINQKITTTQEIDNITELIKYLDSLNTKSKNEITTKIIEQKITTTQEIDNITELIEYTYDLNIFNKKEIITAIINQKITTTKEITIKVKRRVNSRNNSYSGNNSSRGYDEDYEYYQDLYG